MLNTLSDQSLHEETLKLVMREREMLVEVLKHLLEIDRRKLFSSFRYPSLYEYCVKELSYSEDQAYRRISAMRALREMPELEPKVASGALTLTNMSVVAQVVRAESRVLHNKISLERKLELFNEVENKSKREAERALAEIASLPSEILKPERVRELEDHIEWRLTAKKSLQEKVLKVKAMLSHSNPNITTAELFEKLCDEFLNSASKTRSRMKQSKCENCGTSWFLESDHIVPKALGGSDKTENRRDLCRSCNCNQRAGIEKLGVRKMTEFRRNPQVR